MKKINQYWLIPAILLFMMGAGGCSDDYEYSSDYSSYENATLKVALVNDRPVLGGNNSAEVRVHLGGYVEMGPNEGLGRMIREFGHTKKGNAQPASNYEDDRKQEFIDAEENITLFANYHATAVRMDGDRIEAVLVRHIETGEEHWLSAPLFSDCTGDGTIGYLAGADWRMGREARSEFGEFKYE